MSSNCYQRNHKEHKDFAQIELLPEQTQKLKGSVKCNIFKNIKYIIENKERKGLFTLNYNEDLYGG